VYQDKVIKFIADVPADSATPTVTVGGQIGQKGVAPGSGGLEAEGPDVNKNKAINAVSFVL